MQSTELSSSLQQDRLTGRLTRSIPWCSAVRRRTAETSLSSKESFTSAEAKFVQWAKYRARRGPRHRGDRRPSRASCSPVDKRFIKCARCRSCMGHDDDVQELSHLTHRLLLLRRRRRRHHHNNKHSQPPR